MKRRSSAQPEPMRGSWLIQRLGQPIGRDNPFSFGGGMHNGGLSAEAMDLLRGIFSFDYMGAAEFEFGALPQALKGIARDARHLTAFTVAVPLADVPPSWRAKNPTTPEGEATLYVLCREGHATEVRARITKWATTESPHLKERPNLTSTLRPYAERDGRTVGWLELDNGFFFFAGRSMWERTCALFEVTAAVTA